ncbi:hypothetical protein HMPREF1210_02373 [Paenisporosarcina sp. HGH0030]|nr:hypothetical protein HMPREF1210_02373 [Paenisporosarcina sp. HGH0030]
MVFPKQDSDIYVYLKEILRKENISKMKYIKENIKFIHLRKR